MRNFFIWALISICGVGLIFDAQIRNDYYTAFSYLFPVNTKEYQDLADTTRLIVGLAMTLSVFNIFSGFMLKLLSVIGFVIYSVVINQSFIINPSTESLKQIASIAIHITLIFICMDSIIGQIITQQTKSERERTRKAIVTAKNQADKVSQEVQKPQNQKPNPSSGKNKVSEQSKKEQKGQQKQKKQ